MLASVFFLASFINELLTSEWLLKARDISRDVVQALQEARSSQNFVRAVIPYKPCNSVTKWKPNEIFALNVNTETVDYRIKPEIYFCQDCRMFMKITPDETEYICPICHQVKENNNYTPERASSHAHLRRLPQPKTIIYRKEKTNWYAVSRLIIYKSNKLKLR